LLAVLSGFPAQPVASIITQPEKFEKLPSLAKTFNAKGYNSSFYYGGESEFANIKAYMVSAGFQKILDKNDFSKTEMNSKWGAHDHVMFDKVIKELEGQKKPFFANILTLSSHEPFEIPIPSKYKGIEERNKFKSSVYYTDKSLGGFMEKAKSQPWYQHTLFVLVADHGHRLPKEYPELYNPGKYRIPLLFYGAALKKEFRGKRIHTIGGQTDIAATLLGQLGIKNNEFSWSKNLLHPKVKEFAFYDFNDGFGWVTPQGPLVFDNVSHQLIWNQLVPGNRQDSLLIPGKAYMQQLMTIYSSY
jgi:phosphoglycerol transferase MdoB-like AlkP superfamily enzyme